MLKNRKLAEQNAQLSEQKAQLTEQKAMLKATVQLLVSTGIDAETIAAKLGKDVKEIQQLMRA